MFTLLLAWVNAKYSAKYRDLFIATIIYDMFLTAYLCFIH